MAAAATLAAVAAWPSPGAAQEWLVYGGVAARAEYNDNYFFTAPGQAAGDPALAEPKASAYTVSVLPFVAASRRTEVSSIAALLSIGANKVWGASDESYPSGSLALDGSLREDRSTWGGRVSYTRTTSLENAVSGTDVLRIRTYRGAATMSGTYEHAWTDRWTVGATAGAYANRYDRIEGEGDLEDDHGYNVGGTLRYALSDRTQLSSMLGYVFYESDVTRSHVVATNIGVAHQYSPQLTLSASVGAFWSDTRAERDLALEDPVAAGENRTGNGTFYGGSIRYAFSETSHFEARLSQSLTPSSTGALSRNDQVGLVFVHQFSDRLTARLGASYARTSFPTTTDDSFTDKTLQGQAGLTYQLAEHWRMEAGYQYTRAKYSQSTSEPRSNVLFVSVGYNWPGSSLTGWVGAPLDVQGLTGAGPVSVPETSRTAPAASPLDPATLP